MFPYFGKKQRHVKAYPAPVYSTVIEPFAGSMGYSLQHRPESAIGIEKDEEVFALWQRILDPSWDPAKPVKGTITEDLFVRLLSYSEHALTSPRLTVTSRMLRDWDLCVRRAKEYAVYARANVALRQGDYSLLDTNKEATWFVDPPYQKANRRGYRHGAQLLDFERLADWCRSLKGQVIVCEQEGADWLPFEPLYDLRSHKGAKTKEVVWINS